MERRSCASRGKQGRLVRDREQKENANEGKWRGLDGVVVGNGRMGSWVEISRETHRGQYGATGERDPATARGESERP